MPTEKEQEQGNHLLSITESGSATLIKAARIRNDSRMLLQIDGRDTILGFHVRKKKKNKILVFTFIR